MGDSCIVNSFRLPTFKSPNGFSFMLHREQQLKEEEQKMHINTNTHTHIQSVNISLVLVISFGFVFLFFEIMMVLARKCLHNST